MAVNIVLINCLITVILEAFIAVRTDINKQSNDYEIVDFMMKRLKLFLGIGHQGNHRYSSEDKDISRQSESICQLDLYDIKLCF